MQTEIRAMERNFSCLKTVCLRLHDRGYTLLLPRPPASPFTDFNQALTKMGIVESCLATLNNLDDLSGRQVHPGTEYGFSLPGRSMCCAEGLDVLVVLDSCGVPISLAKFSITEERLTAVSWARVARYRASFLLRISFSRSKRICGSISSNRNFDFNFGFR